MSFSYSRRRSGSNSRLNRNNDYQSLESRQLLAVTSLFEDGVLTVNLDQAADNAIVRTVDNIVTVNDQQVDADSSIAGVQALEADQVNTLVFVGNLGLNDLGAHVNGEFNSGNLATIEFNNINRASLNGVYDLDSISGTFVGSDSFLDADGSLNVSGAVELNSAAATEFQLFNPSNDFGGEVSIVTGGSVALADANSLVLGETVIAGDLTVSLPTGELSNQGNVAVGGLTSIEATDVALGQVGTVDLSVMTTNVSGHFDLIEVDEVAWGGISEMGSAHVSAEYLTQQSVSEVNINGDAEFDVVNMRLGVGGRNTFNIGRMNFNVSEHAFVFANSDLLIFGDNTAMDLDLLAGGDIRNVDDSTMNVAEIASFQSTQIVDIGNASNDIFNAGTLRFWGDTIDINEDSDMVIDGLANYAQTVVLTADGTITDTDTAYVVVEGNARFVSSVSDPESGRGEGVTIGDSENDFFIAGSISFQVLNGTFNLTEDDSTEINGVDGFVNESRFAVIRSAGAVTNNVDTTVIVERNATFGGQSITLGQRTGDLFNLGSATFVTPGDATFTEDDSTLLGGQTFVGGDLNIESIGDIQDSQSSFINVIGTGTFVGNNIILGDLAGVESGEADVDNLVLGMLSFRGNGDVEITENNSIIIAPDSINTGNTVRLTSRGDTFGFGSIFNLAGASLIANGDLHLEAINGISLGANPEDVINFDNLNFQASEAVNITAIFEDVEDEFFIFGTGSNGNKAGQLRINTNVDVRDGTFAEIEVDEFMRIEARGITLGDTDDDCLMIPEDAIFVTEDLGAQVETDDDC